MDLRAFISEVDKLGELKTIEGAHWDLEIGAVTYLAAKNDQKSPALLFDKIPGYKPGFRVFASPCTTDRRMNLVLRLPLEAKKLDMVKNYRDKVSQPYKPVPPIEIKDGPILENVLRGDDVDVFMFPTPRWQDKDGGRYIGTGDTVVVRDPDDGWINVGTYRVQLHDRDTVTVFMEPGKHADIIRKKYWSKGQPCPAAITFGGDPLHVSIAGTSIPWKLPEYDYIGWWDNNTPIKVIKGPVTGLPVPCDSEIVFEGYIMPPDVDSRLEGPFSEWTGHYTPAKKEAAFKVKSILHRNDPILLAVLPFLGCGVYVSWSNLQKAARLWSHLDAVVPGVKGVWNHVEFGGPHCVVVSISQKYGGHAKQTAMAAAGHLNYFRKFVIIVDDDIDPSNLKEVIWAVGMRSDPAAWDIVRECWSGNLNPLLAPEKRAVGDFTESSALILACKPFYWMDKFPPRVVPDPGLEKKAAQKWPDLL